HDEAGEARIFLARSLRVRRLKLLIRFPCPAVITRLNQGSPLPQRTVGGKKPVIAGIAQTSPGVPANCIPCPVQRDEIGVDRIIVVGIGPIGSIQSGLEFAAAAKRMQRCNVIAQRTQKSRSIISYPRVSRGRLNLWGDFGIDKCRWMAMITIDRLLDGA